MRASTTIRGTVFMYAAFLLAFGACGGEAEIGEECGESGVEEGECVEGAICGKHADDSEVLECLVVCTDHPDCEADESCNGVEGSSTKGCREKDDTKN